MGFVDYRQCEVLAKNSFSELNGIERLVHNHSLYTHLFQREFALSLEVQAEENSVISQHMLVADVAYLDLDDAQKEEAVAFMRYLYTIKPKRVGECQIPSDLDDMLEASGYRYGLLVYDNGMTRSTKGFLKSAALGLAIGILTTICTFGMFTYYPYAVPYSSDMNMAILDSETNRVVFYNYAPNNDRNPSLQYDLLKQLAYLYRDFIR